jgi:phosphoribosylaminoimidazole-succinocarboxamide synthase
MQTWCAASGVTILPVEIVVRGYLAGTTSTSILTQYKAGRGRCTATPCPTAARQRGPAAGDHHAHVEGIRRRP